MKSHTPLFAICLLLAAAFCGCVSDKIPTVTDSQLNWVQIRYYPLDDKEPPCYMNLLGVGSIEFKRGLSPLVEDDFSVDTAHSNWQDIEVERLGVPPDVIRAWMQRFLDAGLYQESKRRSRKGGAVTNDIAVFLMKNGFDTFGCRTMNPDLVGPAKELADILGKGRGHRK